MAKQSRKDPNERDFHSFDGSDIRVTHPDGSVAIVGDKPRPLPKKLWRAAIKAGCQTDTSLKPAQLPELSDGDDAFTRMQAIKDAMVEALEADDDNEAFADAFTANDLPNVRWLEKKVGFSLTADERDQAWAEVQSETDSDEGDDGQDESE
jgi:hypothetical protein